MPTSTSLSITSTDRTRLSRICCNAFSTISPEFTWMRALLFWASTLLVVTLVLLVKARLENMRMRDSIDTHQRAHRQDGRTVCHGLRVMSPRIASDTSLRTPHLLREARGVVPLRQYAHFQAPRSATRFRWWKGGVQQQSWCVPA